TKRSTVFGMTSRPSRWSSVTMISTLGRFSTGCAECPEPLAPILTTATAPPARMMASPAATRRRRLTASVPDLVRVDRVDPQAVEPLAVAVEQRQDEPLPGLVPPQQLAQALGRLERPARLGERLSHDDLGVVADPV